MTLSSVVTSDTSLTNDPPGYRKNGDERRSTVTFKSDDFKHDPGNNQRVRLSKGSNLKEHFSDFILCEYQTRPDVDLSEVNKVQNVRAVWNGDEWELHFVCKINLKTNDSVGDGVAGIDLGIKNIATVAFPDVRHVLYPNSLKQDNQRFEKHVPSTTQRVITARPRNRCGRRGKLADRETHFYHTLTDTIITQCVSNAVLERSR